MERIYTLNDNIDVNVNNLNVSSSQLYNNVKYLEIKELLKPYGFIFLN